MPHLVQEQADLGQARAFLSSFLTRAGIPDDVRHAAEVIERWFRARQVKLLALVYPGEGH